MGVESKQAQTFMVAKNDLQDDALLVQLVLASPYCLGPVLSHIMDGHLAIAYASRMFTAEADEMKNL